jgi:spore coat polysaccharide biosynthesis predicted glycosyltransferase SpsG
VLTGPRYALLRPEFAALREYSLNRRANLQNPQIKNLLITMGGVDLPNATGQVLEILKTCPLPDDCRITVVMGTTAPALAQVRQLAAQMPWPTTVLVNVMDMAQHMADSDLAIGAAGGTSWERCSLGLPTLMVVLADNQRNIAAALDNAGAAVALDLTNHGRFVTQLQRAISRVSENGAHLSKLSLAAAGVTEGHGTDLIVAKIVGKSTP